MINDESKTKRALARERRQTKTPSFALRGFWDRGIGQPGYPPGWPYRAMAFRTWSPARVSAAAANASAKAAPKATRIGVRIMVISSRCETQCLRPTRCQPLSKREQKALRESPIGEGPRNVT